MSDELNIGNKATEEEESTNTNVDPNAIGQSDHDKAMMDLADGKTPESDEDKEPERPDYLPEKFKTVEEMAKAYTELEKKLGANNSENDKGGEEDKTAEDDKATENDDKSDLNDTSKIDPDALGKEIQDNGKLSEKSYEQLEALGFTKEMVDTYVNAVVGQDNAATQETVSKFHEVAGGEEAFNKIAQWASKEGDQSVVNAYDRAINNGDTETAMALLGVIKESYTKANGSEGISVKGSQMQGSGDTYESWAQVSEDMNNPKYAKDPAFVKKVEEKLKRSRNIQ